jgi:NADH:ubiquinone oxidoreductase subunit B-like Fe-S oxidoreductase
MLLNGVVRRVPTSVNIDTCPRHPRGSSHALAALAESFEQEQAALARGDTATLTETDSNDSKITV